MKKYYKNLFLILFIAAAFTACNKDDESDKYPGVPTGTIVPIEERAFVLTGADDPDLKSTDDVHADYKFWTFKSSKVFISGCGESEEVDLLDELGGDVPEIAFAPDGNIMARDGDDVYDSYSDWEWADADKSGIILSKFPDVTFEFTALNEHQVVYASIQNITYEDCDYKVITYEELTR